MDLTTFSIIHLALTELLPHLLPAHQARGSLWSQPPDQEAKERHNNSIPGWKLHPRVAQRSGQQTIL